MAKTVLIPQTTFTATIQSGPLWEYNFDSNVKVDKESVSIVYDNVQYQATAEIYDTGGMKEYEYTIQEPPVLVVLKSQHVISDDEWITTIAVTNQNEHTIEVYVEDEPVVTVQKPGVQVLQLDERLIIFDETTGDIVTFDGENWLLGNDGFGKGEMPSKYAVVGTAIVGKDVVAPQGA